MLLSPFADDIVDLVIEEGVKVVTTGAGNQVNMGRFHDAGITVIPVIPSVALAKRNGKTWSRCCCRRRYGSWWYVGKLTTMALVRQLLMRYLSSY